MKLGWRIHRLSIFGRTFLLNLASLLVAEAIGLALYAAQPSTAMNSLSVADVARALVSTERSVSTFTSLATTNGRASPSAGSTTTLRAPVGPPPDDRFESLGDIEQDWLFREAATPPIEPQSVDRDTSAKLRALLAIRIGDPADRVRIYVTKSPFNFFSRFTTDDDAAQLRRGFIAAWQKPNGQWRVLQAPALEMPNLFTRQTLLLFVLGLIAILPLSWMFAGALSKPIDRFAAAARRLGTDTHHVPLEHDGPAEMSAAIDAFNAMQSRLTRLLQERSQMVGAIAHDLRTPLMRIAFRVDSVALPLKEKIEADLQEMQLMVAAALDFVRDQSLGGTRERLDFRLLIESVVDDQHDVGHDVTLQSGEPIIIHGDPLALRRVVANLVDNALKYGERARLRLRATHTACTLEVDDDGPGIPETLQERVFEPFFRTEVSRNRDTGGIGLGLTTVRGVVLDHGGSIELLNRKTKGLRVIISLPMPNI